MNVKKTKPSDPYSTVSTTYIVAGIVTGLSLFVTVIKLNVIFFTVDTIKMDEALDGPLLGLIYLSIVISVAAALMVRKQDPNMIKISGLAAGGLLILPFMELRNLINSTNQEITAAFNDQIGDEFLGDLIEATPGIGYWLLLTGIFVNLLAAYFTNGLPSDKKGKHQEEINLEYETNKIGDFEDEKPAKVSHYDTETGEPVYSDE